MRCRIGGAIRKVGGLARVLGNGNTFPASIQPERLDGNGHTEIGIGVIRRFTMYTICDDVTMSLCEGSRIEYRGDRYAVISIETYCLRDKPVFRRGVIILEQEDGDGEFNGA